MVGSRGGGDLDDSKGKGGGFIEKN